MKCKTCESTSGVKKDNTFHKDNIYKSVYMCDKCWKEYIEYLKEKKLNGKKNA